MNSSRRRPKQKCMSKMNKDLKTISIQIGEDMFREKDCWRHVVFGYQNGLQTSRIIKKEKESSKNIKYNFKNQELQ